MRKGWHGAWRVDQLRSAGDGDVRRLSSPVQSENGNPVRYLSGFVVMMWILWKSCPIGDHFIPDHGVTLLKTIIELEPQFFRAKKMVFPLEFAIV